MRYIEINNERYNKGLRIRYKIFNELEFTETNIIGRNAVCVRINQTRIVTIPNIDANWLDFFENGCIIFQIFAVQEESKSSANLFRMTTRDLKIMEQKQDDANLTSVNHLNTSSPEDSKVKAELTLLHRKYIRLEQKEKRIQQLCRDWENNNDYLKFYKFASAIVFSSGTKLKPTKLAEKKENHMEVYLFGIEEQQYLNDAEQTDLNKEKYWDEYYEKMASKQRRVSLSYRVSMRRATLTERTNGSRSRLPSVIHESDQDEQTNPRVKSSLNQEMIHNDNKSSATRQKKVLKTENYHKTNDAKKKISNSEKNSTTCTIQ